MLGTNKVTYDDSTEVLKLLLVKDKLYFTILKIIKAQQSLKKSKLAVTNYGNRFE